MAAAAEPTADRVGIGWRPELAAGILSNLDRVDVVEVIADDLMDAPSGHLRAIQTLRAQVSVVLHGVSLGLSSCSPVERSRLERMARVVGAVRPELWSEHLAFVRSGGHEIGHLAAPPRTLANVEGTARNVDHAHKVVGAAPLLENVATLIEPPGSTLDEPTWLTHVLASTDAGLLLDLNNLHTNALNLGEDPEAVLARMPLQRVVGVHIAGGKWISSDSGERRMLDDHLHDVPDTVYTLLEEVGARSPGPLTVVLERDGAYPSFDALLAQLDRARAALRTGRARATSGPLESPARLEPRTSRPDEGRPLEDFLARLYVDAELRRSFLAAPRGCAARAGLPADILDALTGFDRTGLELAARSFSRKREQLMHASPPTRRAPRWWYRLVEVLGERP